MSSYPEPLNKEDVLFELGDWMILSTEKLAGFRRQTSVIGHRCAQFDGDPIQFLDEEDALLGACWWCREEVSEEVQALWQMQNADRIPEMNRYTSQDKDKFKVRALNQKRDTERVETDSGSKLKHTGMIFVLDEQYWGRQVRWDYRNTWRLNTHASNG